MTGVSFAADGIPAAPFVSSAGDPPYRSPLPPLSVSYPAEPLNASIAGKAKAQEPPVRAFVGGLVHLRKKIRRKFYT
jgi:hypothetical protein